MQIEPGMILEGRITAIRPFGAFVELEPGVAGLVHISEVALGYVENIVDVLAVGQTTKVMVVSVSPEGRIALSIRRTLPRPEPNREKHGPHGKAAPGREKPRVWQPPRPQQNPATMSFEDMMSRYKQCSEEKIGDLNRAAENHRGGRRK